MSKNRKWTREDLEDLNYMSLHGYTITEMSNELERSRKQIIQALKRIQVQQALFNPHHEVAIAHNTDLETFRHRIKDELFYIPLASDHVPSLLVMTSMLFGIIALYGHLYYTV